MSTLGGIFGAIMTSKIVPLDQNPIPYIQLCQVYIKIHLITKIRNTVHTPFPMYRHYARPFDGIPKQTQRQDLKAFQLNLHRSSSAQSFDTCNYLEKMDDGLYHRFYVVMTMRLQFSPKPKLMKRVPITIRERET